jgi:hypothetical protein
MNILLVFDNVELLRAIETELGSGMEPRVNVRLAINEMVAKNELSSESYDLIITPLHIRENERAPLAEDRRGLKLLQWMNANGRKIPGLLIVPAGVEVQLSGGEWAANFFQILTNASWITSVTQRVKEIIYNIPVRRLEIEINLTQRTHWQYSFRGVGFYQAEGFLEVDERTVYNLVELSRGLASKKRWTTLLRSIGDQLMTHLVTGNMEFGMQLGEALVRAGGPRNARILFVVERNVHDMALEALPVPGSRGRYWMLEAPFCRRLGPAGSGKDLFSGQEMNCLIIDASVSGWVTELKVWLDELSSVSLECRDLADFLNELKSSGKLNIGKVELLRVDDTPGSFATRVKQMLESRSWDLVHYAGHSYYDEASERGYVFFPDPDNGSIEKIDSRRFSDWLRRANLVYFSSCDSGAGAFVFELADRRVSNIIGFRWSINDKYAREYAGEFYERLFERRSIETAFLAARRCMYEAHEDDPIWAAPLLIEQVAVA